MSLFFQIHAENPQHRLIHQAAEMIHKGGVIILPTDSGYAMGCQLGDKNAIGRIRQIREVSDHHNFTLACRDLSEISIYARVDNSDYRLLKATTPGPYTFILLATREVPKRLQHPKKRTIGLRVPSNPIAHALLEELNEPLITTTLILPGQSTPEYDPYEIRQSLERQVDLIIDGGHGGMEVSTVVDLTDHVPVIVREGLGATAPFVN